MRRTALGHFVNKVQDVVENLRARARLVRDYLSGQNFSPITLPLRNFSSPVLTPTLMDLFYQLGTGTAAEARALIQHGIHVIEDRHPIVRTSSHTPYFEDERGLRFKAPGRGRHGWSRKVADGHLSACLINNRARFGGPLKANFHYDCEYERRKLDDAYPTAMVRWSPRASRPM